MNKKFFSCFPSLFLTALLLINDSAFGYDVTDQFSIGGVLAGAYQYQTGEDIKDTGRGAVPFQPEINFRPTRRDEVFIGFGFGAGDGLNDETEFSLAPWAADMEEDVKDINGRSRDYLLTAWYKHSFDLGKSNNLSLTGGIIDSTAYIDENAFANDEFTQFMNEALVNAPNGFLPSYDIGGVAEWEIGRWDFTVLGMNVGENEYGNSYNYYGAQLGYKLDYPFGEGNYRLVFGLTNKEFVAESGDREKLMSAIASIDQKFGEILGVWVRIAWQDDKAIIAYDRLFSGGIDITGEFYGRKDDNIGLGYAYLDGEYDFDSSQAAEVYWRFSLNEYFAMTADLQYIKDDFRNGDNDAEGFIFGARGTVEF